MVSIDGIGGIGKTALALEVAYECLHASQEQGRTDNIAIFDGFIWATAKDLELDLEDLLDAVARTLDYPGVLQMPSEQKRSAVRRLLRANPYMLIVDNWEAISDADLIDFMHELPEPTKVLITTRKRISLEATMLTLEDLKEAEALALMRSEGRRLGLTAVEHAGDQILMRLYQSTSGAPLAIKWAVGQIRQRGQSMETVLATLRKAKANIFDSIFASSWGLLSSEAQQVIKVMPLFATSASQDALEAAGGVRGSDLDEALGQLVEMSLVEVTGEIERARRRYSIHPLTRAFIVAMHKLDQMPHFIQDAQVRILKYYRKLVLPPESCRVGDLYWDGLFNDIGAEQLEQEWANLDYLIRQALDQGDDNTALYLFLPVVHFLNAWGYWNERLQLSYQMCDVAQRLENPSEAWLWIDAIGFILREQRQISKCMEALRKGRLVAERFGLTNALVLADAFEVWLCSSSEVRDIRLAHTRVESALAEIDWESVFETGNKVRQIIADRVLSAEAALKESEGDLIGAKEIREQEVAKRLAMGLNPATQLTRLGHISLQLDDFSTARVLFLRALPQADLKDQAWCNYGLALIAEHEGDVQEAHRLGSLARDQFERLGLEEEKRSCTELLDRLSQIRNGQS